ncbi:glycosyltransferase family 4 protein [Candidatus Poribacteria bacterium]|nr:glycosyltransferase family 4 protein [Candidatus Poribacteria bacterium]
MNTRNNMKIAYILSSFPSIAQTFVIRELIEVKKYLPITIISLTKPKRKTYPIHKQAEELVAETFYFPGMNSFYFWNNIIDIYKNNPYVWTNLWTNGKKTFMRLEKKDELSAVIFIFKMLYYAKILIEQKINHIHIHFAESETTAGMVLGDALNISFSFTAHGRDLFLQDKESLTEKSQKAKFAVLGSEFTRNFFLEKTGVDKNKALRIYAGVDPDDYKIISCMKKREVLHKTGNIFKIITVGRLVDEKGYPYILGACRILKEHGVKFQYKIVGKGSKKKILQLKKICREYAIEDCVEILGALTIEQIKPLYEEAHLFAFGSVREVIGVVLMEALSCGIPTVATNITGIPELIKNGENGILVPAENEKALAEAMETILLDDNLAEKFSIAGRKTIVENFDVKETIKALVNAFLI